MARVLVCGATGLLGCALVPALRARGHSVVTLGRSGTVDYHADLTMAAAAHAALDHSQPDVIVNLAALTNVDVCESAPNRAYRENVRSVENLASWLARPGRAGHLVQISTDQVYDGPGPHAELDVTITNHYAFSKYAAELAAASVPSTILRTNFFGRSACPGRASFSDWLVQSLQAGTPLNVVTDVLFSPLAIPTLVAQLALVVEQPAPGRFNLGSRAGMSKAEFAFMLAEVLGLDAGAMRRVEAATLSLSAYRPGDMRMDCTLFERTFGVQLPLLADEINLIKKDYSHAA
ncbi:MAG: SDR family oxidoreductase [Pseudomonadota bacterium]